ncbi:MAG TPA: carboxypeptidase-like regulatory domain-containing protein, partial [Chryseosolibacter sp.]|nr:carboxypeptidase-like regulatory domain-containing protein [Chryseosolibacter sp.]
MALTALLLMCFAYVSHAQTDVKGKVTDEAGEPLPGTNVLVKGSTTGTTTDSQGDFEIAVPPGDAVLVFSFIGYETTEVNVAGQSTINISLKPSMESLSEVVV